MDCRNGEVLAMANNPSFDPEPLQLRRVSQAQWQQWTKDRRTPLINKATSGCVSRLGSTFKMAVALAGLDIPVQSVPPTASVCRGYHRCRRHARFHCWRKGGHGMLDLQGRASRTACDVYLLRSGARATGIDQIAVGSEPAGPWGGHWTSICPVPASRV